MNHFFFLLSLLPSKCSPQSAFDILGIGFKVILSLADVQHFITMPDVYCVSLMTFNTVKDTLVPLSMTKILVLLYSLTSYWHKENPEVTQPACIQL